MKVFEVLDKASKARTKGDTIKILKDNETWALKDVIRASLDKTITFNLPSGAPPYTECEAHNHPSDLQCRNVDFKYIVKGGAGDKMPPYKRESIFISILESVHPEDAKVVINMINKKWPYKSGISKPVIDEAFPGLIKQW
jgi:hypothetical protein